MWLHWGGVFCGSAFPVGGERFVVSEMFGLLGLRVSVRIQGGS